MRQKKKVLYTCFPNLCSVGKSVKSAHFKILGSSGGDGVRWNAPLWVVPIRAIHNANLICIFRMGSCCHNHVVKTLVLSSVAIRVLQMVLRCAKGDYTCPPRSSPVIWFSRYVSLALGSACVLTGSFPKSIAKLSIGF